MEYLIGFFTFAGLNFTVWSVIGIIRYIEAYVSRSKNAVSRFDIILSSSRPIHPGEIEITKHYAYVPSPQRTASLFRARSRPYQTTVSFNLHSLPVTRVRFQRVTDPHMVMPSDVAAIVPAHNEERTIARTIRSLMQVLTPAQIYIGSDASTDRTVEIAEAQGVQVADIRPNRGKANVLVFLIQYFRLLDRYKAVMIVDADSEVDREYLKHALPLFNDPDIAAVAVHATSKWEPHRLPGLPMFFVAYRMRFYRVLQAAFRYGQTWKHTCVTNIVPGFASIYRTSALRNIEINAPGLVIEDFNMTFELHRKMLGKVGYSPRAIGVTRDPHRLRDYVKQVRRWSLGFWQTVRRHGVWPGAFWVVLSAYLFELLVFSLFFLSVPVLLLWSAAHGFEAVTWTRFVPPFASLTFLQLFAAVFVADYLQTVVVAAYERKPLLLVYGIGFPFLRYLDAFILLYTLPLAFLVRSDGRWKSPAR